LRAETPVAVANVDFHVSLPAATVTTPGTMVMIMGTSNGHLLLGDRAATVEGMCGVVEDGIVPGLHGFEAGQSAVGDIFAWFVEHCAPPGRHDHATLEREAALLRPGESGLLAIDWWNGNRSVLVDTDLSGLLVGMTLATTAPEIYRALIEATAFGTRVITDAFEEAGLAVDRVVACGGLPARNSLVMQIYADVTGREFAIAASTQVPALGAAIWGAVAAGVYDSIDDASKQMAHLSETRYEPNPAHRETYDALYREYVRLHDLFGRGGEDVMRRLKQIRHDLRDAAEATAPQ
jgi:L-ribulokinase